MVYRWEQHRQTCYRLYVEENKSLEEVVEYMRVHHNFTPSRRAFQSVFSRWGFPNKLNPAYKNEQLVARVRELWEASVSQKEMVGILVAEGFQVGEREVARIRLKNGWTMRTGLGGYGDPTPPAAPERQTTRNTDRDEDGDDESDEDDDDDDDDDDDSSQDGDGEGNACHSNHYGYGAVGLSPADAQVHAETLAAMRQAGREERKRLLALESHERWMTKKRRRHTKPYAGLPADPPCPPRFPSETTLAEAKAILQLDASTYRAVRAKFSSICVNAGVYKKTLAGPERWEALKDQLVRESMHLRAVMWDPADMDRKRLAIEIIACDVTKSIRTAGNRLGLPDAARILGLNPEQSRALRGQLYNILFQEKFTSKFEEGLEYFEALRQRWIAGSDVLSAVVASGGVDTDYERKMRAIQVLCRDATRRYQHEVLRKGKTPGSRPPKKKKTPKPKARPKAKPAKSAAPTPSSAAAQATPSAPATAPAAAPASTPHAPAPPPQRRPRGRPPGSRKKLPHTESRLVLADEGPPPLDSQPAANMLGTADTQNSFVDGQYAQGYAAAQQAAPSSAIAVFFRLHPASAALFPGVPQHWIRPLSAPNMEELRSAAVEKCRGAVCISIEGIVKDGKGGELPLPVSDQVELETYLQHVQGHGAPTFHIQLVPGGQRGWA